MRIVNERADSLGWWELAGRDEGCRGFEGHTRLRGIRQRSWEPHDQVSIEPSRT
jgi:hypothetical protein